MAGDEMRGGLPVLRFENAAAMEAWLERHGAASAGFWLRLFRKDAGVPTVTRDEAIDAALRFGWIDGRLDKYDSASWLIRFTPRRARSKWSEINVRRVAALESAGRMRPAGLAEVAAAKADGRWAAAYAPQSRAEIPPDLEAALDASPAAAAFFATLTGANRYAILYRIGAVKKPETRARKVAGFVAMLERGETVHG